MTRTRTSLSHLPSGSWHYGGSPVGDPGSSFLNGWSTCIDVPGPGDCAPLSIEHVRFDGGRITSSPDAPNVFVDRSCGWVRNLDAFARTHILDVLPEDGDLATQLMSRTNPSRPHVDLVANIAQMRFITELLREEGRTILQRAASHNLEVQFALVPTLSDLTKLLDFQAQVEKRIRLLTRMRDHGLRTTITLFERSPSVTVNAVLESLGVYATGTLRKTSRYKIRGHIRWNNTFGLEPEDWQIVLQARSAVLGVTLDAATLWEAIPWSWLIDWCTNVGDYLIANRNICNASCTALVLMHQCETSTISVHTDIDNGYIITPVGVDYITRDRVPASPSLSAQLPILTMKQMGILGSIGVLSRH